MANYLVRLDKVRNLGQVRACSTAFGGRISSFDWVDTGVGKEGGSGRKVRGMQYSHSMDDTKHRANIQTRESLLLHIKFPPTARHPRLLARRLTSIPPLYHSPRQTHSHRVHSPSPRAHNIAHQNHQVHDHLSATTATEVSETASWQE